MYNRAYRELGLPTRNIQEDGQLKTVSIDFTKSLLDKTQTMDSKTFVYNLPKEIEATKIQVSNFYIPAGIYDINDHNNQITLETLAEGNKVKETIVLQNGRYTTVNDFISMMQTKINAGGFTGTFTVSIPTQTVGAVNVNLDKIRIVNDTDEFRYYINSSSNELTGIAYKQNNRTASSYIESTALTINAERTHNISLGSDYYLLRILELQNENYAGFKSGYVAKCHNNTSGLASFTNYDGNDYQDLGGKISLRRITAQIYDDNDNLIDTNGNPPSFKIKFIVPSD